MTQTNNTFPNLRTPPSPPKPPPCRVEYRGALSSFSGPEDEYEKWKETPKQQRLGRAERWVPYIVAGTLGLTLFGGMAIRIFMR